MFCDLAFTSEAVPFILILFSLYVALIFWEKMNPSCKAIDGHIKKKTVFVLLDYFPAKR